MLLGAGLRFLTVLIAGFLQQLSVYVVLLTELGVDFYDWLKLLFVNFERFHSSPGFSRVCLPFHLPTPIPIKFLILPRGGKNLPIRIVSPYNQAPPTGGDAPCHLLYTLGSNLLWHEAHSAMPLETTYCNSGYSCLGSLWCACVAVVLIP